VLLRDAGHQLYQIIDDVALDSDLRLAALEFADAAIQDLNRLRRELLDFLVQSVEEDLT